jgi:hypothetical protein
VLDISAVSHSMHPLAQHLTSRFSRDARLSIRPYAGASSRRPIRPCAHYPPTCTTACRNWNSKTKYIGLCAFLGHPGRPAQAGQRQQSCHLPPALLLQLAGRRFVSQTHNMSVNDSQPRVGPTRPLVPVSPGPYGKWNRECRVGNHSDCKFLQRGPSAESRMSRWCLRMQRRLTR